MPSCICVYMCGGMRIGMHDVVFTCIYAGELFACTYVNRFMIVYLFLPVSFPAQCDYMHACVCRCICVYYLFAFISVYVCLCLSL